MRIHINELDIRGPVLLSILIVASELAGEEALGPLLPAEALAVSWAARLQTYEAP